METIKRKREEEAEAEQKKRRQVMGGGGGDDGDGTKAAAKEPHSQNSGGGDGKIYTTDLLMGTSMTSGRAASSLTSTAVEIANVNDVREATAEEILDSRFRMMKRRKRKGFVRLATTKGAIDLEVHADIVPRTAANFLGLVEAGKYDGSVFHRSIANFMIQGGKPADKAEKEESLWGAAFEDEFDDRLSHSGPGILSMANAGPGTNKRQFFLTYKSCAHLDRKHSVFGRVVKGLDVLRAMEAVPTGKADRPTEDIKILAAEIMGSNPVTAAAEAERERIHERAEARRKEKEERRASALGQNGGATGGASSAKPAARAAGDEAKKTADGSKSSGGVGKYLPKNMLVQRLDDLGALTSQEVGGGEKKGRKQFDGTSASSDFAALPGLGAAVAASRKPANTAPSKKNKNWDFSGW
jgi:cyclophilin family peptidyl-prolyl cis-trans isomerase